MKKLENFSRNLNVLKNADFEYATENDIYRAGVTSTFSLTFELAWKALQTALKAHGVEEAETGSPREILQLGYKIGFIDDPSVWLAMLKRRNFALHVYNGDYINDTVILIRDSFIPAFVVLEETLKKKLAELEDE